MRTALSICALAFLLNGWSVFGLAQECCSDHEDGKLLERVLSGLPSAVLDRCPDAAEDLRALFKAYPKYCTGMDIARDHGLLIILNDGRRVPYDDGRRKTFDEKLEEPDLQDMLEQPYPARQPFVKPPKDTDPGRRRVEPFFKTVYGESEEEVSRDLLPVRIGNATFQITRRNRAADSLKMAALRIEALLRRRPELARYVFPPGGSFKWRTVAKTTRLSPHAFGIALDLNPAFGPYWRSDVSETRTTTNGEPPYPMELVDIFEQHFFAWGGRWRHYDFMHFEYRPELFLKAAQVSSR